MKLRFTLKRVSPVVVWLVMMFSAAASLCAQQTPHTPKRILLVHDYGQEAAGRAILDQHFNSVIRTAPPGSIEFYSETLELYRFPGESHAALVHNYLRQKYTGIEIDVMVVVFDAPLDFMRRYRAEIFPGVPIVYLALRRPDVTSQPAASTGLWEGPRVRDSLEMALKLQPDTQQVFIVSGRLNNEIPDEHDVLEQLKTFQNRVTMHYFTDLPMDELTNRVRNLPPHSIVLCPGQNIGVGGRSIPPYEAAAVLAQASNVPVYGIVETWVGGGVVGGKVVSLEDTGAELAKRALQILNGTRPEDLPVAEAPTVPMFDWRQLQRFNISEDRLPAGSVVRFKQFTFWEQYKGRILLAVGVMLLQAGLISGLLIERRRKKRAARTLAESEDRFARAFKANPQPMSITTFADGRYVDVNESFVRMSGFTAEELIGRTSVDLNIFDSHAHRQAVLLTPLNNGSLRNLEMNFRKKDGSNRVLLSSYELLELHGEKCILVASSDITERKESEQRLAELTGRLLRTQDDERRRIARELHDVTAQSIGLIMLNLSQVQTAALSLDERAKDRLSESLSFCEQALKDIRTLSYVLHPPLLDHAGLTTALKWYVKGFSDRSGVAVAFTEEGTNGHRMPPEVEYALFRIVQESLTNIRRHTNSETAEITLKLTLDEVLLSVRDEGRGLQSNLPRNGDGDGIEGLGVGILGMRHRLKQLGGELLVDSDPNGTIVTATVPVRWVVYDSGSTS